jgi:hypothetical protein
MSIDQGSFVSSVCWVKNFNSRQNLLLSSNSQGNIDILNLKSKIEI